VTPPPWALSLLAALNVLWLTLVWRTTASAERPGRRPARPTPGPAIRIALRAAALALCLVQLLWLASLHLRPDTPWRLGPLNLDAANTAWHALILPVALIAGLLREAVSTTRRLLRRFHN